MPSFSELALCRAAHYCTVNYTTPNKHQNTTHHHSTNPLNRGQTALPTNFHPIHAPTTAVAPGPCHPSSLLRQQQGQAKNPNSNLSIASCDSIFRSAAASR